MRGHGIPGEAANDVPPTNGGQAFPRAGSQHTSSVADMTLRDYFAGQAMHGMIASDATPALSWAGVAACAYSAADAMLKERAK